MAGWQYDQNKYLHGSGRFPSHRELTRAGYGAAGRLSFGYVRQDFENKSVQEFSYSGVKSCNMYAYNRSHKGTTLGRLCLEHEGSLIAFDPRDEMFEISHQYREEVLGQKIILIDPTDSVASKYGRKADTLDILSCLDELSLTFFEDTSVIADGIFMPEPSGSGQFWSESGMDGLRTAIADEKVKHREKASLLGSTSLFNLASGQMFDALDGVIEYDDDGKSTGKKLRPGMVDSPSSMVAQGANRLSGNDEKTLFNIVATIRSNTNFLQSGMMKNIFSSNGIPIETIVNEKVSLYIIIPTAYSVQQARVIRLIITLCMFLISRSKTYPNPPALFILDEIALLGKFQQLIDNFGIAAGDGCQVLSVWHDIPQMRNIYPQNWETMINNAGVNIVYGTNDLTTMKYFEEFSGTVDIRQTSNLSAAGQLDRLKKYDPNRAEDQVIARPLITKERLRTLAPYECVFFPAAMHPIIGYKAPYFLDSKFRDRRGHPIFNTPLRYKNNPLPLPIDYIRAGLRLPELLVKAIPPT